MKGLTLVLFFIQVECICPCTFDKVEQFSGEYPSLKTFLGTENQCFAACYEDENCKAIAWNKGEGSCNLYGVGTYMHNCIKTSICYILQRDEVDPMCRRYVNFPITKA